MLNKLKTKALSAILFLLISLTVINFINSAEYQVSNGVITFSTSSQDGVYHSSYIYLGDVKKVKLEICNQEKCSGNSKVNYGINQALTPGGQNYNFKYYDFNIYEWKTIEFSIPTTAGFLDLPPDPSAPGAIRPADIDISLISAGEGSGEVGIQSPPPSNPIVPVLVQTTCISRQILGIENYADCVARYTS